MRSSAESHSIHFSSAGGNLLEGLPSFDPHRPPDAPPDPLDPSGVPSGVWLQEPGGPPSPTQSWAGEGAELLGEFRVGGDGQLWVRGDLGWQRHLLHGAFERVVRECGALEAKVESMEMQR